MKQILINKNKIMSKQLDSKEVEKKPELYTLLGVVVPPNEDVENGDLTLNGNFYEKHARMHRALINWRKGVNGKIDIKVNDENKEWLLALNEETNDLIRYFDYVFGNNA
ncbi:MAG: hypothetical protein ACTSSH_12705 [Candidatus Heimdallarchaeota archaeon]